MKYLIYLFTFSPCLSNRTRLIPVIVSFQPISFSPSSTPSLRTDPGPATLHQQTTSTPFAALTAVSPPRTTIPPYSNATPNAYKTYTDKADNEGESAWEGSVACNFLLMLCRTQCLTHNCGLKVDNSSSIKYSERIIKTERSEKKSQSRNPYHDPDCALTISISDQVTWPTMLRQIKPIIHG